MEDWLKAGKIAKEVREWSKEIVKKDAKLLDVAEKIENKIRELGAIPAFPVNISMNEIAAHYTPVPNDELRFENQVVKIDIGVCYEGAIGDTAYTVDFSGKYGELVKASEEALKAAIEVIKVGVTLGEIGKAIQDTINSFGFLPISNLSGHGLDEFIVHDKPSIPNYDTKDKTKLEKKQIIAIEPFATNGKGLIKESSNAMIFSEISKKPIRDMIARNLMKEIKEYEGMPFTTRWLAKKTPEAKVKYGLRLLEQNGNIKSYPPLPEVSGAMITQAEHSLIVDDEVVITTL